MAARTLALLYLTFWGCSPQGKAILHRRFSDAQWVYPDTVWGILEIPQPSMCQTLELEIKLEEYYPWRNLYLLALMEAPDGLRSTARWELVFADTLGRWYSSNRRFRTFVAQRLSFATAGTYRIGLLPYIRSDTVKGVREIVLYAHPCLPE